MWVIGYLGTILLLLLSLQTLVLLAFNEPLQWTFGANSQQPKSLKLALKIVLQGTLIGSLVLFPYLVHSTPVEYYGKLLPLGTIRNFVYGQAVALVLMATFLGIETACGWLYWKPRWTAQKAFSKSAFSALSSLTVVTIEEPLFRGIILQTLIASAVPWIIAVPLSAVVFSGAHFIRKVKTYWPAVGLAVLGLWLGVAYVKTGDLWLAMGLHSGGILAIGIQRCFLNYKGPEWLVGNQTFPIAGVIAIAVMLVGTVITWFAF